MLWVTLILITIWIKAHILTYKIQMIYIHLILTKESYIYVVITHISITRYIYNFYMKIS